MIKNIKSFLLKLSVASLLVVPMLTPVMVHAAAISSTDPINNSLCNGVALTTSTDACANADETQPGGANDKVNKTITLVINIFSIVVGIVAVIMIVLGGLKYITSAGDSNNVTSAKNTILYAVVGLVVVALAQFIVRFVLGKVNS
jgi:cytochrome bd-type quinol oxidase subunit 2